MSTSTQLLTIREAAEVLRLHPATVRRLVANGEIPGRRIGGQWRVPADEFTRVTTPATATATAA